MSIVMTNNFNKSAVALAYTADYGAPRVIAKGNGYIAEAIISKAKEHGIFVHESKELISLLSNVNLDDEIPPQLYIIVAELLAWIYQLENSQSKESTEF